MVEPLQLSSTRPQYSRPGIVLEAANTNNEQKYGEKDRLSHRQSHRFVAPDNSYSLNLVV